MTFNQNYTIPKMLRDAAKRYDYIAAQNIRLRTGLFVPVTYDLMFDHGLDFAAALLRLGVKRADKIAIIADNRAEWLQADIGILSIGAIDVPRGCNATAQDLIQILTMTKCNVIIVENSAQLNKLVSIKDSVPKFSTVITLCEENEVNLEVRREAELFCKVFSFSDLVHKGIEYRKTDENILETELEKGCIDDAATIIFTSGTTGIPKGVVLSHRNFLTQLDEIPQRIYVHPEENIISVLPVWHVFERVCEYVTLVQGGTICYSKPIGKILLDDFQTLNPVIIPAVPRVFESIYDGVMRKIRKSSKFVRNNFNFFLGVAFKEKKLERKIFDQEPVFKNDRKAPKALLAVPYIILKPLYALGNQLVFKKIKAMLGTNFRCGVSGGGALPANIDEFFWAIGINVVEGYGMTETAPIISVRPTDNPVFRTVGKPIRGIEVRVVNPENGAVLPQGNQGVLEVKGGIVMQGYYNNELQTSKVLSKDGWLNTGDIAVQTATGELQIKGRIKDTIVLRGGENLEPVPIETKLSESRYISQAVVFGQDRRYIVALILVNKVELEEYAETNGITYDAISDLITQNEIKKLYEGEISDLISSKNGFKSYEKVSRFFLTDHEFREGYELSAKQEVKRKFVEDLYKKEIESLYED